MNPRKRAKQWVLDGALTQDTMCKYSWVENDECKLCGGPGTEKHRLYHCKEWNHIRLQLESEVRLRDCVLPCSERAVDHQEASRRRFYWMSEDPDV